MDEQQLKDVVQEGIEDPKTKEVEQRSQNIMLLASKFLSITSQEEKENAVAYLKEIKTAYNEAEKRRKFLVSPLNDHVKAINNEIKQFTDPLVELEKNIKDAIASYTEAQERIRLAEQARIIAEAQKEQDELNKMAEESGEEAPIINVPLLQEVETTTSGATVKKVWTFDIEDVNQIPREYLIPDQVAINTAVKAGARDILGVRIYQKSQVSIRT